MNTQLQTTHLLHNAQHPLSIYCDGSAPDNQHGCLQGVLVSRFTTLLVNASMSTHPRFAGLAVSPAKGLSFWLSSLPYL